MRAIHVNKIINVIEQLAFVMSKERIVTDRLMLSQYNLNTIKFPLKRPTHSQFLIRKGTDGSGYIETNSLTEKHIFY